MSSLRRVCQQALDQRADQFRFFNRSNTAPLDR